MRDQVSLIRSIATGSAIYRLTPWLVLLLLGCTAAVPPASPEPPPEQSPAARQEAAQADSSSTVEIPAEIPAVDISQHSVPLDQIYFDTFRSIDRAVPLDRANPELIESLIDAIPPLHNPEYAAAADARWLRGDDIVLGYAAGGEAWAYPIRILNFHEIVNDDLAGQPVLISYCPLCYSGIAYSRRLEKGEVLTFGNTSALYESDMVMLDYDTGSYWWQVAGEAIVGPLTGEKLTPLPSQTTTWETWRDLHPNTQVLSRNTGYDRNYDRDPFAGYASALNRGDFAFPVGEAGRDGRLPAGDKVLIVRAGGETAAYPLAALAGTAVHDTVGGQALVIFVDPDGVSGAVFEPAVKGQTLTFTAANDSFVDAETGSRWDLAGRATAGALAGERLTPLPSKLSFWFAAVAAEPELTLYRP